MLERIRLSLYALRRPLIVTACVVVSGASVLPQTFATPRPRLTAAPLAVATPVPPPVATPLLTIVPDRIQLPSLKVEAPVIPVGIESDGAMGTPSNARDVAWWDGLEVGAGNALLAGHKDYNRVQGSFFQLQALKPGDPIVIHGQAGTLTFVVEWVRQMDADSDATEILGPQPQPTLTLITCGGKFDRSIRHYQDRVVARAVLQA